MWLLVAIVHSSRWQNKAFGGEGGEEDNPSGSAVCGWTWVSVAGPDFLSLLVRLSVYLSGSLVCPWHTGWLLACASGLLIGQRALNTSDRVISHISHINPIGFGCGWCFCRLARAVRCYCAYCVFTRSHVMEEFKVTSDDGYLRRAHYQLQRAGYYYTRILLLGSQRDVGARFSGITFSRKENVLWDREDFTLNTLWKSYTVFARCAQSVTLRGREWHLRKFTLTNRTILADQWSAGRALCCHLWNWYCTSLEPRITVCHLKCIWYWFCCPTTQQADNFNV